jgi:alpha-mannosidase
MTSPQWFEAIENHFTAQSFVDFVRSDGSGILVVHNGSQQWFFGSEGIENLIAVSDPWDEHRANPHARVKYRIHAHGPISNAERYMLGREMFGLPDYSKSHVKESMHGIEAHSGRLPRAFRAISIDAPNVVATAFYREIEEFSGHGLESYAGQGMGYPFILRLIEFDGISGDVEVTLPGPIAKAVKTNLLGERAYGDLEVKPGDPNALIATPGELEPFGIRPETIAVPMRPYEIATIYLDLVPGRKVARDLDAKREIWATVHRTES